MFFFFRTSQSMFFQVKKRGPVIPEKTDPRARVLLAACLRVSDDKQKSQGWWVHWVGFLGSKVVGIIAEPLQSNITKNNINILQIHTWYIGSGLHCQCL